MDRSKARTIFHFLIWNPCGYHLGNADKGVEGHFVNLSCAMGVDSGNLCRDSTSSAEHMLDPKRWNLAWGTGSIFSLVAIQFPGCLQVFQRATTSLIKSRGVSDLQCQNDPEYAETAKKQDETHEPECPHVWWGTPESKLWEERKEV